MSECESDALGRMMGVFRGMIGASGGVCFECGAEGVLHFHHVVPRSLGGKNTVPLCEECHGKVHDRDMVGHRKLVRGGLDEARRRGQRLGRPVGSGMSADVRLGKHKDIVKLLREGHSVRNAAAITGKAPGTVQRVKALLST